MANGGVRRPGTLKYHRRGTTLQSKKVGPTDWKDKQTSQVKQQIDGQDQRRKCRLCSLEAVVSLPLGAIKGRHVPFAFMSSSAAAVSSSLSENTGQESIKKERQLL